MSYDSLNEEIQKYELSLFNPSKYVKLEQKHKYEYKIRNFTQEGREKFLIGMMKVNFLKRLESCVHSFAVSMERTVGKIDDLQKKIRSFNEYRAKAETIDLDRNSMRPVQRRNRQWRRHGPIRQLSCKNRCRSYVHVQETNNWRAPLRT